MSSALSTATNWTTTFLVKRSIIYTSVNCFLVYNSWITKPFKSILKVTRFSTNVSNLINNSGTYFCYASVSFGCAIFTILVVPETKGKSPEDMKMYFMSHNNKEELSKSQYN